MASRVLMILGAGRGQVSMIRTAIEDGLEVVAIDPSPLAPGLKLAHHKYTYDLSDNQSILTVAHKHQISGVATLGADYPMPLLGTICAQLRLPGPTIDTVACATNKRLMRAAFVDFGVPCPRSIPVKNLIEAVEAISSIGTECIIKPVMSQGGRGITRVAADTAAQEIATAFRIAMRETRADGVLVEEFVDGPEFSVEAITWRKNTHVVAVTDKLTSGAPYYVELGHSQPSRFSPEQINSLREAAVSAVEALGIDNAPSHTELRLTSTGPLIMETAARLGGGFITSHLVPLSCGVNIVRAAIQVALGEAPDLTVRDLGGSAIRFLKTSPGVVSAITGLNEVRSMSGVVEAESYVCPGDRVIPLRDATGRIGHVICVGKDVEEAVRRVQAAYERISISTHDNAQPFQS